MPEKFGLKSMFIVHDGTWVPFEGITEVQLSDDTDLNDINTDAVYARLPDPIESSFTIEFDTKRRDRRKLIKFFKKQANIYGRRVRHYKRQKERARRRALKGD